MSTKEVGMYFVRNMLFVAMIAYSIIGSAYAGIVTFDIEWSGLSFDNNATANGFISIDDSALPEIGSQNIVALPSASDQTGHLCVA